MDERADRTYVGPEMPDLLRVRVVIEEHTRRLRNIRHGSDTAYGDGEQSLPFRIKTFVDLRMYVCMYERMYVHVYMYI